MFACSIAAAVVAGNFPSAALGQPLPVPPPAHARAATFQTRVATERDDQSYRPGDPVKFLVRITADNEPVIGARVRYELTGGKSQGGKNTGVIPRAGVLVIDGGTLPSDGLMRCGVEYERDGRTYRGSVTAGRATETSSANVQVVVAPDHPDWTYRLGERVKFNVQVTSNQRPLPGASVRYTVGPEMLVAEEKSAVTEANGTLVIDGGTMHAPGFIRCIVTHPREGRLVRGLATAAFDPGRINPTQTEAPDFDEFWQRSKAALAKIPLDARLTPIAAASNAKVDSYYVSFRNVGVSPGASPTRIYGVLCEPKGPGPFPALLHLPGAGVKGYRGGQRELAEAGIITLDLSIHGIPIDLPTELYDELRGGAFKDYYRYNLDDRELYYYWRVYLGCVRANDFLVSRPKYDGRHLAASGRSQGGQLSIVTAVLDPRVTCIAANHPAYSDVTGYLRGRAGGWPHLFRENDRTGLEAKLATTRYYDTVNFAKRLTVPGHYSWGYNDEVCPPTSTFAAYNVITAPKTLTLTLELGHTLGVEQQALINRWLIEALTAGK